MTDWIKQHKYAVIIVALSILLFCCSCLFIAAALDNKPAPATTPAITQIDKNTTAIPVAIAQPTNTVAPTIQPTLQPTVTPTIDTSIAEYKVHVVNWAKRTTRITDVISGILSGEDVSPARARQAGTDLGMLRAELHDTIPPPVYAAFHTHYTNGIDALYDAVVLLAEGKLSQAVTKLEYGKQEMDKAVDSLPKQQNDAITFAAIEIPTIAATFTFTPLPTQTSIPTQKPTPKPVIVATVKPVPAANKSDASKPCLIGQIKGNRNSMIYHAPNQSAYARTKANVECFDTEQQAINAGYRRAKR